jgi:excisionase family DNA binding protein
MDASSNRHRRREDGVQVEITREWVTYKQAEELSGLSRTTLWKLLSAGEIKAARVGRAVRITIVVLSMDTWSRLRRVHREAGRSLES